MRFRNCLVIVVTASMLSGCYANYSNVGGAVFPRPAIFEASGATAGVMLSPNSTEPPAASLTSNSVTDGFAKRLNEENVFSRVIYPYGELAGVEVDVILDTTVHIIEETNMGGNMAKAVLTGASMFVLSPVLPIVFGVIVDVSVEAKREDGTRLGTYAYRSEYEMKYTAMTPDSQVMREWLDTAKRHAIEEVINQIKADTSILIPEPAPEETLAEAS